MWPLETLKKPTGDMHARTLHPHRQKHIQNGILFTLEYVLHTVLSHLWKVPKVMSDSTHSCGQVTQVYHFIECNNPHLPWMGPVVFTVWRREPTWGAWHHPLQSHKCIHHAAQGYLASTTRAHAGGTSRQQQHGRQKQWRNRPFQKNEKVSPH